MAWRTFLEGKAGAEEQRARAGRAEGRPRQAALQTRGFLKLLGSGLVGPPRRGDGSCPAGGGFSECDARAEACGELWSPTICLSLTKLPARPINEDKWAWPPGHLAGTKGHSKEAFATPQPM